MEFPQYRKYKNIETYFLIYSPLSFEEIRTIGSKYTISEVEAIQFPEKLLIQDMLENKENRWEILSEVDFLTKIALIKKSKTKIR